MSRMLKGRRQQTSSATVVTADNVAQVLDRVMPFYQLNQIDIGTLYDYYLGDQAIQDKTKKVRPEINNIVTVNHSYEVASFVSDQIYSDPIQYVRRGMHTQKSESIETSEEIAKLNVWMDAEDKTSVDAEIGLNQAICGTAYRMILPDETDDYDDAPFEIESLDPKTTSIVYNSGFGHNPIMSLQEIMMDDGERRFIVYTPHEYFELSDRHSPDSTPDSGAGTFRIVRYDRNPLGLIPIVEYPANPARQGAFEPALAIWDAINTLASNRLDGVEQFVQFILKFINCDFETDRDLTAIKEQGAIAVYGLDGVNADVEILSSELDQTQVQTLMDDLYTRGLKICGVPFSSGNGNSADTGASAIYRDGWETFDKKASKTEQLFKRAERQFLRLALKICKDMEGFELPLSEIEIKFTRNRTDNLLVKTQGMLNQLEAGIHPQVVITNSQLYHDPEQVYVDSQPYLEKWLLAEKPSVNRNADGESNNSGVDPNRAQRSVENANGTVDA